MGAGIPALVSTRNRNGYAPPVLPDATLPPRPHDVLDRPFGSLRIAYDERLLEPRDWTTAQSYWAADLIAHVRVHRAAYKALGVVGS